jgi:hypothetical protein
MALLYIYAGTCLPDRHLIPHLLITNPTPLDFSTLPMAVEAFRAVSDVAFADARMKLTCSHGGRLVPSGSPDAAPRYVGGETRVLAFPRSASFRDLTARLSEMAGGVEVRSVRHRLADDEDVVVSVTCDEELAHMRDVYDRLRAPPQDSGSSSTPPPHPPPESPISGNARHPAASHLWHRSCGACRAARRSPGALNSTVVLPPTLRRCGASRAATSSRGPAGSSRPSTTGATTTSVASSPNVVKMCSRLRRRCRAQCRTCPGGT